MKILFLGDVVGRSGRDAVCGFLPSARKTYGLDFVVVNGENAAAGFGITPAICEEFFKAGVDVITTGNHVWDQQEIIPLISREKRLLRPHNYPEGTPGTGVTQVINAAGKSLVVIHVQGQIFMHEHLPCPFACVDGVLKGYTLGANANAIFVDIHAEITSEKMALGHHLDGRVSGVIGTHTHVPTADARIFNGGTAYQTDAGMCGDYNSVIGMEKPAPIKRFLTKINKNNKMVAASGPATICGAIIETDDKTGLATSIEMLRIGGSLESTHE
jgi:metallophosphoesterase (TIGR00282 family)